MIRTPLGLKLIYTYRHFLGNDTILGSAERRMLARVSGDVATPTMRYAVNIKRFKLSDFELDRFRETGGFKRPFVLEGLFDGPLLSWDELAVKYGNSLVPVHLKAEKGGEWQHSVPCEMPLQEAIRAIDKGNRISVVSCSEIFNDHPGLASRTKAEVVEDTFGIRIVRQELFIGGKSATSAFHCAMGGNFFLMACGSKRWTFVSPSDWLAMYPTIGRSQRSAIFCSPIDTDRYEDEQKEKYPLYATVQKYTTVLGPGDVLFNPSWWWHEVTNLEPSVGIPMRSLQGGSNRFFLFLTLLSSYGLNYVPRGVVDHILRRRKLLMTDAIPKDSFGGY